LAAKKHKVENLLRLLCLFAAIKSVNQNEDGGILGGFDDILKLPVSRDRRFELGRNGWHGFDEAQQRAALRRVIHILRNAPLKESTQRHSAASAATKVAEHRALG
jgi:hypothetical protein